MKQSAQLLYDQLTRYSDLQQLIDAETESTFLECKAPKSHSLSNDLIATLAKALSGFSNTNGGIIIWGISTT